MFSKLIYLECEPSNALLQARLDTLREWKLHACDTMCFQKPHIDSAVELPALKENVLLLILAGATEDYLTIASTTIETLVSRLGYSAKAENAQLDDIACQQLAVVAKEKQLLDCGIKETFVRSFYPCIKVAGRSIPEEISGPISE